MKLKSIHVNLMTIDNAAKMRKSINEPDQSSTTREEKREPSLAFCGEQDFPSSTAKESDQLFCDVQKAPTISSTNNENPSSFADEEKKSTVPEISIFSLQDDVNKQIAKASEEREIGGIFEEIAERDDEDEDSIEEFDPEDSDFQEQAENEDEMETEEVSPDVYKYDMTLKSYVRLEDSVEEGTGTRQIACSRAEEDEETQQEVKQSDILKKRLLMPTTKTGLEGEATSSEKEEVSKVQTLDLNNPLSVNNAPEEDGVMYVTVKGAKPNELLLVKVKKMDKPVESKRAPSDLKPVERILKRYETLALKDYSRRPDAREQIIEEQIEEYKRKREKILGGKFSLNENRKEPQTEDTPPKLNSEKLEEEVASSKQKEDEEEEEKKEERVIDIEKDNTEKYLSKLRKLKSQLEEANRKEENLQRELLQELQRTEGDLERLARILSEKEKHLQSLSIQEFQEYLKQRKIIVARLKDEDIINLYEDRHNSVLKSRNALPDLIDASPPTDPLLPENCYFECDYCPEAFSSRDVLEEHLRTHDYRILYYCEDCGEEFMTNKGKRNHNVVCLRKLICKYCDLLLDSRGKKRQHEQKHIDNMYGQLCEVCGERFKHQGTLDQHLKTQHTILEKIYQCPKCPKKFAFKQKLSFHLKSVHTTLRAYLCEDCGADFKNPASLRHHRIRKHQPVGNKRECPVCRKLVPFYSLSKHMHTHKAYSIQCPHCDKMFKNSSTLKQHVRIHEDQRQYRCDTCGVGFNRRDGLRLHMRVHQKTDSRGLKECSCQVCGEKFPNHSTLVIHRNRVHKDGRQYTCHICNRSMISTRSLEWHMSHIHNESLPGVVRDESGLPEKRRVSCYHCSKTFKTEMILRTHIKNMHMEKDPMKCADCDATFTSEVRLRHHMMVTHNRLEGTLACPHCPKRFVNQLRLKTHMISHSEERPYTCEICGFNLKTKIQLIKHHQNRHSDERPLQCRYCPWRCKQVSALVCHERTHTNERPYSCSVCRQRFKYLGDKNKHERRHESLGGAGFKRIVPGRNIKPKQRDEQSSASEQESESVKDTSMTSQLKISNSEQSEEQQDEQYAQNLEEQQMVKFEGEEMVKFEQEEMTKFDSQEISEQYEEAYEQEYEETSREASEATEVIMNMEDPGVYTEEVTADNMEAAEMMTEDEIITSDILQSTGAAAGTTTAVVHLQQQDDSGKIQVIPVMLSLPDLSDTNTEVNLATASIMYNN